MHNTGGSLDDEQLGRVFDRFWRADPSRQRATGGSGLGLAIVKHLVEAHGGRVWAVREREGTTFALALPGAQPGRRSAQREGGQPDLGAEAREDGWPERG